MKKLLVLFIAAALLAPLAFGGGQGASSGSGGTRASSAADEMFDIVLVAAFTGFDPLRTNDAASTYVNAQIYETLYRLPPATTEYTCLLAESLPVFSADGLTASIKLREGIKFHDGTPFNAEAVKYTIELIKDPKFGSSRASIASSIAEVEIVNDYNLKLHLTYPDGVLTAKLAHTNAAIVSPTAQKKQDLMVNPVGTGPYKFVSSVSGSNAVLTRNDDYHGKKPVIKDVTMTIITEESTALSRMETGEADFLADLAVPSIGRVRRMPNVTVGTSESARMTYFATRPNSWVNPVMANLNFRIALAKAIDRQDFVDYIVEGYGVAAHSVMGPQVYGYDPKASAGYTYDPEGARKIITDNGWTNEEILFLVPTTPTYTPIGEYIQANLKAAGFNNIKIEAIEWSAWLTESQVKNRFDITLGGWSNVTRDGSELFEPNWHSTNSSKRFFIDSPELDALIMASKMTSVEAERIKNLRLADELMMKQVYTIPLYHASNVFCYNNKYANINRDAGGTFYVCDFTVK
ncbi:MAG: ABC transporter substrate-binding protein [Treponema sp.]|jgi:peptide/nickel transport system substrate-binding protein|nr:ABC transporter substrate-binding protein [Treponema sp.]